MNRRTFIRLSLQAGALAAFQLTLGCNGGKSPSATVSLAPLPYAENALEPYMSARTLSFHYGQHHRAYVETTNRLVAGTALAGKPLAEIIARTRDRKESAAIFNNAAQVYNHEFFWQSMDPGGGGAPQGVVAEKINSAFGSHEQFGRAFSEAAGGWFGSGWIWLVADEGALKILCTANADTPADRDLTPLLTLDLWEHAYYLDYQNRRREYIEAFLEHLINWERAAELLGAGPQTA
jgi:Fe-Mn family superoxide dismutase